MTFDWTQCLLFLCITYLLLAYYWGVRFVVFMRRYVIYDIKQNKVEFISVIELYVVLAILYLFSPFLFFIKLRRKFLG